VPPPSGPDALEALSRGAASADFVELAARSLRALRDNAAALHAGADVTIHRGDALRFMEQLGPHEYDVVFADPPYRLGLGARIARQWLEVPFAEVLSIEHAAEEVLPEGGDQRRYGDTAITIYRAGGRGAAVDDHPSA
jgi:16S rRNA (guanine966-N2)-methyltransferase